MCWKHFIAHLKCNVKAFETIEHTKYVRNYIYVSYFIIYRYLSGKENLYSKQFYSCPINITYNLLISRNQDNVWLYLKIKAFARLSLESYFLQVQFSMGFEWNLLRETKYYITRCFFRLSLSNLFENKKCVIFNFYNIEIFIMTLFMRTLSHWECIMKQTLFVPRKIIFPFTCILCFFLC